MILGGLTLVEQVQLNCLVIFQQRDYNINTGLTPCASFIIEPVSSSWPGSDGQPPKPWTRDPEEVSFHGLLSPLSFEEDRQPVMTIKHRSVGSDLQRARLSRLKCGFYHLY
jgi:hypothetical protein